MQGSIAMPPSTTVAAVPLVFIRHPHSLLSLKGHNNSQPGLATAHSPRH